MPRSSAETVQQWVRGVPAARVQALSVLGATVVLLVAVLCGLVVLQG